MATVNKPGGIISGIDVPEWNVENEKTNSRLTIVMDPIMEAVDIRLHGVS